MLSWQKGPYIERRLWPNHCVDSGRHAFMSGQSSTVDWRLVLSSLRDSDYLVHDFM
jgi:hypothetical protein